MQIRSTGLGERNQGWLSLWWCGARKASTVFRSGEQPHCGEEGLGQTPYGNEQFRPPTTEPRLRKGTLTLVAPHLHNQCSPTFAGARHPRGPASCRIHSSSAVLRPHAPSLSFQALSASHPGQGSEGFGRTISVRTGGNARPVKLPSSLAGASSPRISKCRQKDSAVVNSAANITGSLTSCRRPFSNL